MRKIKNLFRYLIEITKYFICLPIGRLVYGRRNIYLISERGTEARDNGFHLFRYIRTMHPECECYYIIEKESPDMNKVKEFGNIVYYRSFKHYLLFAGAKYKISTHIMGYSPDLVTFLKFNDKIPLYGKRVFLQHGITKDDIPMLYAERTKVDLFICGARPEYEYIKRTFHYQDQVLQYTGFARYDKLHEIKTKKQILIMPTWRMYLSDLSDEELEKSEYVIRWNEVLNNKTFAEIIEKNNIQVIFYPHHEMQKKLHLFSSFSKNIVIASFKEYDVQALLMESKLLITDYSSVFFDFAYMKKTSLYYQFDSNSFYEGHYHKGYFDYYSMGFGEVSQNLEELIERIIEVINQNFVMNEKYIDRVKQFFPLYDTKNCERIFEKILKM